MKQRSLVLASLLILVIFGAGISAYGQSPENTGLGQLGGRRFLAAAKANGHGVYE